jgi:hypothetical protein
MELFLHKLLSLFQGDPFVRFVISMVLLIGGLFIVSLLPQSWRFNLGVAIIGFVAILNFRTVLGWIKEFFS